ncbi:MAG: hypothetical protein WCG93_05225 [Paludibacter sp.]
MKKIILLGIFAILVQSMFAWSTPQCRNYNGGSPEQPGTIYLGDNGTFGCDAWGSVDGQWSDWKIVIHTSSDVSNGTYGSQSTTQNITHMAGTSPRFTSTGTWYWGIQVHYGSAGYDWYCQNNTSYYNMWGTPTSNLTVTVTALSNPTSQGATAFSSSQINLSWVLWNTKNVMVVRRLTSASASTTPSQGTTYTVGSGAPQLGTGTVVYNGGGTSFSDTGLTPGTGYTYTFYTENWSYYSAGVTTTATTTSTSTATDYFRSKASGNWGDIATWESSPNNSTWINATLVPDASAASTTILNTHTVTLAATAAAKSITVATGGTLDCASYTLTIATGSTLTLTNGATFTAGTGTVAFAGSGSITGTIVFNNVSIGGGVNFGSASTINGTLTVNANGSAITNGPTYGASSKLDFATGGSYSIDGTTALWVAGSTIGKGVPKDVTISTTTPLNIYAARDVTGNLNLSSGKTIVQGNNAFIVQGNFDNYGTYSFVSDGASRLVVNGDFKNETGATTTLSAASGGDLEIKGNLNDNGTFNANNRAIFFTGGNTQVIQGTGVFDISYVRINKTGGSVQLATDLTCAGPGGGNAMEIDGVTSILDLNGHTLYLGQATIASTYNNGIATPGFIKGSSTSNISILGTGALGTINFYTGSQTLNNLTVNRTSSGTLTIGTDLMISGALTSTAGTLSMGSGKILTLSSVSTTPQTQCANGTFSPALTVNSTGATYQWYSNGSSSYTGGALIVGATTNSYTPIVATGTKYYYCAVSGLATAVSNVSGLFTVNAVTAISSQSTATQTQCIGGTFSPITVTATGIGLSYQWYSNTIASNTGGTSLVAANGAQTSSYTPQAGTAGTLYYYCIVTGTCSTATTSISGAFVVNVTTAISSQSTATQTQCVGGSFSPITVTAAGVGLNYQWYSNTSASNTGGTSLVATNGAQTSSYTPQSGSAGTLYYYCIVTGTCSTATTSISGAFVVNVATAISSQSTATQTQNIGGSFSPITVTAIGTGTLTYQWYSNASNSNSGGVSLVAANGAQTSSYTPQTGSAGTVYYYCVVTGTCSTATSAVSGAFVTLNAVTVSANTTSSALPCSTCDITVTGGTLTLDANLDVSNALTLTSGVMDLNGKTLTLGSGSSISTTSGTIKGGGNSSISVTGTGALGTLNFDQTTPGTSNLIKDLTINRTSAGTATIGNDLIISNTLQVTAGTITSSGGTKLTLLEGSKATTESGSSLSVVDMVFSKGTSTTSQFDNKGGIVAVSGKIKVKVNFPDDTKWHFVSFPFTISAIKKSDGTTTAVYNTDYGQLWYDATKRATAQSGWTSTSEMPTAGKGYAFWSTGDLYFETATTPSSASFGSTATQALTYTSGATASNNGWNFFAHPLTANANGKLADLGEFRYGYNFLTDTYNVSTTITSSEQQSFDAYFVKTVSARTMNFSTISMPASVRNSETSTSSTIDKVTLSLVGATANYTTLVRMLPQSTTAYDELYDAPYSGGMMAETPQIYSLIGSLKCAINSVPEQTTVPIGIRVPATGTYSFTWDAQLTNLPVTLYDKGTDIEPAKSIELTAATTYNFTTAVFGEINNRFSITVAQKNITRLDNGSAENPLYVTNQSGGVRLDGLIGTSTVKLYDMVGKLLLNNVISTSTMNLNVPMAGMYLLEVNKKTMKMVVK